MRAFVAVSMMSAVMTPQGQAAERVRIDYVLPSVTATAGVAQQIIRCPPPAAEQVRLEDGDERLGLGFAYKVVLGSKMKPRRLVSLDTESGFLVDRETKVQFSEDWYLKSFNGKTTGQGGALVVSAIKAAAAVYGMTANPISLLGQAPRLATFAGTRRPRHYTTRWYLECKPNVRDALAELEQRRQEVATLEARIVAGTTAPGMQELLTQRRARIGELEADLTISAPLKGGLTPTYAADGTVDKLTAKIAPPDFEEWFVMNPRREEVQVATPDQAKPTIAAVLAAGKPFPGLYGYTVKVSPDANLLKWFGCDSASDAASACASAVNAENNLMTRDLTYLRPVDATLALWPCSTAASCADDGPLTKQKTASGSGKVKLPQLSRHYTMRTGGSIFGGRTVGAEFGATGEPTMLQYNVGSSGKDVAGALDASVAAAQSIRDADGAATKRELERLKNAKDLQALIEELEKD